MKPNIELAEKLLKEKYSITSDGKEFKLQYPIYVEDLAFIMQKYTEEQLIIDSVSKSFYCWDEDTGLEKCKEMCDTCTKYKGNGVR